MNSALSASVFTASECAIGTRFADALWVTAYTLLGVILLWAM